MTRKQQNVDEILAWQAKLKRKDWWTSRDVAIYIGRCKFYVEVLFRKGLLRRNRENLTCYEWVKEYLKNPVVGMYRGNVKTNKVGKTAKRIKK